jgi:hypothetical protein
MTERTEIMGTDKPTIMYFVDFSALYTDAERMFAKIRDVLEIFRENRESVTLLWHQDPVLMRELPGKKPELWERYRAILTEFEEEGLGILDDTSAEDEEYFAQIRTDYPGPGPTPGEQRAIDRCDAFYGDGGYLSNCFRNAGKPVMLQDAGILSGGAG